ncbi:putative sporulation protein YtaF [Alkalibacillus filiformis]|uniref:Sporulation protein YtaF n=1 Tax=Alkalibacillus filiformis TaxID=200990 RepID=A0ABU0DS09_9BACI|nr:sporulation membrane protein YtaF [Alkalibacillus filiformis]MDQ0351224.1 putative sporulation protein YtaF [Alkalibacillus filiformis]
MLDLILLTLLLSFAVSFDSFFFGLTYRVRSITVKPHTVLMIGAFTACSFLLGGWIGELVMFIMPFISHILGGLIFIAIGSWVLWQWLQDQKQKVKYYYRVQEMKLNIRTIWEILKRPQVADRDQSGSISGMEAVVVAIALSLDSFASGIGAAFFEIPALAVAIVVGLSSMFFLMCGIGLGKWMHRFTWIHPLSFIPGLILISLGIWNFIR